MTKRRNKMLRMWVLYGLFVAIVLLCTGLFLSDAVTSGDAYHLDNLEQQLQKDSQYGLIITDLIRTDNTYIYDTPINGATPSPALQARTSTFDLLLSTDDASQVESPLLRWTMALQVVAVICALAIFAMLFVLMVSLFRSIRQGRLFRRGSVRLLCVVGFLIILFTLSLDTSTYLEREFAFQLLQGTEWEPMHEYTLHVTRLFCGLIVLFIAELLHLGYSLQEEQDLTI